METGSCATESDAAPRGGRPRRLGLGTSHDDDGRRRSLGGGVDPVRARRWLADRTENAVHPTTRDLGGSGVSDHAVLGCIASKAAPLARGRRSSDVAQPGGPHRRTRRGTIRGGTGSSGRTPRVRAEDQRGWNDRGARSPPPRPHRCRREPWLARPPASPLTSNLVTRYRRHKSLPLPTRLTLSATAPPWYLRTQTAPPRWPTTDGYPVLCDFSAPASYA